MIKRAGFFLITLLLLLGTSGLTITRHYCGGRLMNISIYSSPDNCCKGDCPGCHNEKIKFRITDQFESSQARIDFIAGFTSLLEQHSLPTVLAFSSLTKAPLVNGTMGDHSIKPSPTKPIFAGLSTSFLQVFLF